MMIWSAFGEGNTTLRFMDKCRQALLPRPSLSSFLSPTFCSRSDLDSTLCEERASVQNRASCDRLFPVGVGVNHRQDELQAGQGLLLVLADERSDEQAQYSLRYGSECREESVVSLVHQMIVRPFFFSLSLSLLFYLLADWRHPHRHHRLDSHKVWTLHCHLRGPQKGIQSPRL